MGFGSRQIELPQSLPELVLGPPWRLTFPNVMHPRRGGCRLGELITLNKPTKLLLQTHPLASNAVVGVGKINTAQTF